MAELARGEADPLGKRTPATLIGTLRRAEPANARRWHLPAVLGGLLFLRALFYWQIGSASRSGRETGSGVIALSFPQRFLRPDAAVFHFQFWADAGDLLSVAAAAVHFGRAGCRSTGWCECSLGQIDGWPRWIKFLLPFAVVALLWWLASWPLAWLDIIPKPVSADAPASKNRWSSGWAVIWSGNF